MRSLGLLASLQTAVAVIPFFLASFAAAVLVVRLFYRLSPRLLAHYAFLVVAAGVALLGAVVRNEWSTFMVIVSMTMAGLGEGSLVTLLFNVLQHPPRAGTQPGHPKRVEDGGEP